MIVIAWSALAISASAIDSAAAATSEVLDGLGGADGRIEARVARDVAAVRIDDETWVFYGADPGDGHDLRLARLRDDGTQTFRTLDGRGSRDGRTTNAVGTDVSAVVNDGTVHVFYRDETADDLRHGWRSLAEGWRFETIDGATNDDGTTLRDVGGPSAAVVFRDRVQVFYVDADRADIRRAVWRHDGWRITVVDGDGRQGGRTREPLGAGLAAEVWGSKLHVLFTGPAFYSGLREVVFEPGTRPVYEQLRNGSGGPIALLKRSRTDVVGVFQESTHVRPLNWTRDGWRVSRGTWSVGAGGLTGMTLLEDGGRKHMALGLNIGHCSDCGYERYVMVAPWQMHDEWTITHEAWFWGSSPAAPNAAVTVDGVGHVFVGGYAPEVAADGTGLLLHIVGPFEEQAQA